MSGFFYFYNEERMNPAAQVVQAEDNEAAQAAAFASVDDDSKPEPKIEPAKLEPEAPVDPKIAEAAAAQAAADAEWDGVPAKVRQTLEAISGKVGTIDRLQHDFKSLAGRTGAALEGVHAIKAAMDEAKATANAVAKAGGEAPSQTQIAAAAASGDKWKQLQSDFPEWAEGMDERLNQRIAELMPKPAPGVDMAGLKTELTGTVGEIIAKATSEAKAETRELTKIDRKYENWESDIYVGGDRTKAIYTPEFLAWKTAQAPEVQALENSNSAGDAIKMLDSFYEHRKAVAAATARTERNKNRLEAAVTPKSVAVPGSRTISEQEAAQRAFEAVDNE